MGSGLGFASGVLGEFVKKVWEFFPMRFFRGQNQGCLQERQGKNNRAGDRTVYRVLGIGRKHNWIFMEIMANQRFFTMVTIISIKVSLITARYSCFD